MGSEKVASTGVVVGTLAAPASGTVETTAGGNVSTSPNNGSTQ